MFNLRPVLHSWPNEHLYFFFMTFYHICIVTGLLVTDNYKSHNALQIWLSDRGRLFAPETLTFFKINADKP